jgi:hypothetical protein
MTIAGPAKTMQDINDSHPRASAPSPRQVKGSSRPSCQNISKNELPPDIKGERQKEMYKHLRLSQKQEHPQDRKQS